MPVNLAGVLTDCSRRTPPPGVRLHTGALQQAVVLANEPQLSRMVSNLIDNASRYARSTVELSLTAATQSARISVTDDGPRIPEPDRTRLGQVRPARRRSVTGERGERPRPGHRQGDRRPARRRNLGSKRLPRPRSRVCHKPAAPRHRRRQDRATPPGTGIPLDNQPAGGSRSPAGLARRLCHRLEQQRVTEAPPARSSLLPAPYGAFRS